MFNTQRTEEFDEWLAALMDLRARAVLLLLCAGDKSSQQKDIARAISLSRKYEGNSHDSSQTL